LHRLPNRALVARLGHQVDRDIGPEEGTLAGTERHHVEHRGVVGMERYFGDKLVAAVRIGEWLWLHHIVVVEIRTGVYVVAVGHNFVDLDLGMHPGPDRSDKDYVPVVGGDPVVVDRRDNLPGSLDCSIHPQTFGIGYGSRLTEQEGGIGGCIYMRLSSERRLPQFQNHMQK
jgi:hypothetical protein